MWWRGEGDNLRDGLLCTLMRWNIVGISGVRRWGKGGMRQ